MERPYLPNRGDVTVLKYDSNQAYFTKRVIGIAGDTVALGPQTRSSEHQGSPRRALCHSRQSRHSFDSRIAQFGSLTPDEVIGKPVLIYWSRIARIGCPIR
jgi:hypothetical protein